MIMWNETEGAVIITWVHVFLRNKSFNKRFQIKQKFNCFTSKLFLLKGIWKAEYLPLKIQELKYSKTSMLQ